MTNRFKLDMTMMYAVHDAYELALLDAWRDWWGDVSALGSHTAKEVSHYG